MFSRAFTIAALVLATSLLVQAHAAVSPVLGLAGAPARSDVQRPNARNVCGRNVDVAGSVDTSTPVQAAADGTFTMTATNFNKRLDGSRQFQAKVDTTATGDSMTGTVTMVQNGDRAPAQLGSEQIVAQLPSGTQCTGGQAGNLCLVQFRSLSGFGNCVVVQQGGAAATGGANATDSTDTAVAAGATATDGTDAVATATNAAATASNAATNAASTGTTTTGGKQRGGGLRAGLASLLQRRNFAASRAARSVIQAYDLLDSREFDDEEIMDIVGRDLWDLMMELE